MQLAGKVAPSSVVQQTCIDAVRDIRKMCAETEVECTAWLNEILRTNIADAARRFLYTEKREVAREISLSSGSSDQLVAKLISSALGPEVEAISREEAQQLLSALARLTEPVRQIIEWHNRDQLSFVEIGMKLDKTPDAVRMIWNRGVKQLAMELSRDNKQ